MVRYALLALLMTPSATRAAVVELVPGSWGAPAPVLGGLSSPQLAAPFTRGLAPLLAPGLVPLLAPSVVPLVVPLVAPAPALLVAPAAPAALRVVHQAAARPDAREDAVALVRRLLASKPEPAAELSATFDGTVLDGSPKVGGELSTRNGAYALEGSKVKSEGGTTTVYERWTGPGGSTLWVLRRRGPDVWEVREWRGPVMPSAFGPEGLPVPPSHYAEISLSEGRLRSNIETKGDAKRPASTMIDAKKSIEAALAWFGEGVSGIKGTWVYGDNLSEFNRLTAGGATLEEAALGTWTGRRAAAAGYTKVVFSPRVRALLAKAKPGAYEEAATLFVRP